MARRILVTGAGGFVGRHLLEELRREEPGALVYAWRRPRARDGRGPAATADGAVTWDDVDVLDRAAVRAGLSAARPDAVYHLAGAAHVGHSWAEAAATLELNVMGTHYVLDELRLLGQQARVIVPGSATVYAPSDQALDEDSPLAPASPYGLSKLAQEMLGARAAGDDGQQVVLVRAFNHLGPGQAGSFFAPHFAQQLAAIEAGLAPPVLRVGNLEARRDLTDVRDTVRAYRLLIGLGTPGRPYNVCSGRAWSIRDVLDGLLALCHVSVAVEVDAALLRPNDTPLVLGSCARLRQEVGWSPRVPLARTLADLLDEARSRAGQPAAAGDTPPGPSA